MGLRNRFLYKHHSCFFITTTCENWTSFIAKSNSYQLILDSFSFLSNKYEAAILGYVIMPNHFHFILYFKKENHVSSFMRDFKKFTSVKIRQKLDYIHTNPLQAHWCLAKRPEQYLYSSAAYYLEDRKDHFLISHYLDFL